MLERTLSTAVPQINLRTLVSAYAREAKNQLLNDLLDTFPSEDVLKAAFVNELRSAIRGTPTQALIIGSVAFFTSQIANVAISPAVNSMTHLSGALKNILVGAPSLSGALLMLPVGNRFDRTGGKKELLALRFIAISGVLGLTTLSAFTDLSSVDSFDSRYSAMLGLNLLIGAAFPSFLCMTNLIHWYPADRIGFASSLYGGIGNIAPGLFLLVLQLSLDEIGLPLSFGMSAFALMAGTAAMAKYFVESPYHQIRKLDLPHQQAVAIANLLNQERFPLPPEISQMHLLKEIINDFRTLSQVIASTSYGIFLASTISLYIMLIEVLKLSVTEAVLTTAMGSLWSSLVNIIAGKPMDKYDPSKGVYTFCIGSLLTAGGSLMMAIPKPLPNFAYTAAAQGLIFTGTGIGSLASLVLTPLWSDPKNGYSKPYNNGTMGGLLATVGVLWGIVLPLTTALFVWRQKEEGYQNFFYLTTSLSVLSAIMTLLTQQHLKKPLQASVGQCWAGMFKRANVENYNMLELDAELGNKPG